MAGNYVYDGKRLPLVCPYASVASGAGMKIGNIFAIALCAALTGETVEGATEGVWDITALSSDEAAVGDLAYWDNTNKRVTVTSTNNLLIGQFVAAKAADATTGRVKLNVINQDSIPNEVIGTTVTVTTGQVLALNATPKEIVAAPGAGIANVHDFSEVFYDYNSAAYAGIAAGENLELRYTDGSGPLIATLETVGLLDATSDQHRILRSNAEVTPVANAAIVLCLASGEVITGNSPLKVRPHYRPVTLLT